MGEWGYPRQLCRFPLVSKVAAGAAFETVSLPGNSERTIVVQRKRRFDLRMTGDRLEVTVRDEGRGFDLRKLRQNEGLGIRSMVERAHLLGGKFEIHSESRKGTALSAWVPFEPKAKVTKARVVGSTLYVRSGVGSPEIPETSASARAAH